MKRYRFPFALLLLVLLSACLPTAGNGLPLVVFLNGPTGDAVPIAAETVQRAASARADLPFAIVGNTTARFLETRRNISGRSEPRAAANVADGLGAVRAVMIGAPLLERVVTTNEERSLRLIDITLQLSALVIDAESGEVLATVVSRTLSGGREEALDVPLVDLERDPTVTGLAERAASEIAAAVIDAVERSLGAP